MLCLFSFESQYSETCCPVYLFEHGSGGRAGREIKSFFEAGDFHLLGVGLFRSCCVSLCCPGRASYHSEALVVSQHQIAHCMKECILDSWVAVPVLADEAATVSSFCLMINVVSEGGRNDMLACFSICKVWAWTRMRCWWPSWIMSVCLISFTLTEKVCTSLYFIGSLTAIYSYLTWTCPGAFTFSCFVYKFKWITNYLLCHISW